MGTTTARGIGRKGRRDGRKLHLVVADAQRQYPGIDVAAVRSGWNAEHADLTDGGEPARIGGGL